jgi:hypothetical protein
MRRSGLSIIDATTLERDRLRNDDRLLLYRTKTGEEVCVSLEPELAQQLRVLPALGDPGYFSGLDAGKHPPLQTTGARFCAESSGVPRLK